MKRDNRRELKQSQAIKDQPHSEPNKGSTKKDACDVSGNIHVRGEIETHVPDDVKKKREAAEEKKEARDKFRLCVEITGLIIVIIYAGLTCWQAWETHNAVIAAQIANTNAGKALSEAHNQFVQQERPYIWITRPNFNPLRPGKLSGSVSLRNFGKSPALNIKTIVRDMFYGPDAMKHVEAMFDFYRKVHLIYQEVPTLPIPPENAQDPESYATIFPESVRIMSPEDISWIKTHDEGAIMAGVIEYSDMEGNTYRSEYCTVRKMDGRAEPCTSHNEIH
jgi:hypothetical protein